MTLSATRDPREALQGWIASTGYSYREVGELFGVTKDGSRQWARGVVRVPARVQQRLQVEGWLAPFCPRWTPEDDAWLREHAGQWPLPELAARLSAVYGVPRTPAAVKTRAARLDVSIRVHQLLTRAQVGYFCGVFPSTVGDWVTQGWLVLPSWSRHGTKCEWAVPPSALEAFIQDHAIRLDPSRMPPSRYRTLAESRWLQERWLTLDQVAAHLATHRTTIWNWIQGGRLPATLRPQRKGRAKWVIRARDLAAFVRAREQRRTA